MQLAVEAEAGGVLDCAQHDALAGRRELANRRHFQLAAIRAVPSDEPASW